MSSSSSEEEGSSSRSATVCDSIEPAGRKRLADTTHDVAVSKRSRTEDERIIVNMGALTVEDFAVAELPTMQYRFLSTDKSPEENHRTFVQHFCTHVHAAVQQGADFESLLWEYFSLVFQRDNDNHFEVGISSAWINYLRHLGEGLANVISADMEDQVDLQMTQEFIKLPGRSLEDEGSRAQLQLAITEKQAKTRINVQRQVRLRVRELANYVVQTFKLLNSKGASHLQLLNCSTRTEFLRSEELEVLVHQHEQSEFVKALRATSVEDMQKLAYSANSRGRDSRGKLVAVGDDVDEQALLKAYADRGSRSTRNNSSMKEAGNGDVPKRKSARGRGKGAHKGAMQASEEGASDDASSRAPSSHRSPPSSSVKRELNAIMDEATPVRSRSQPTPQPTVPRQFSPDLNADQQEEVTKMLMKRNI
ncbi:hypothetical protein B484DRAFT_429060 [Ochromonadaceae sp. CCMP2298]|nr:hypothetical protein B484DRAFT_429060 [Ochromonadaceae sp. CCMP2298]